MHDINVSCGNLSNFTPNKMRWFTQSFAQWWERCPRAVTGKPGMVKSSEITGQGSSHYYDCFDMGISLKKKISPSQKAQPGLSKHIWRLFSAQWDVATSGNDFQVGQRKKKHPVKDCPGIKRIWSLASTSGKTLWLSRCESAAWAHCVSSRVVSN